MKVLKPGREQKGWAIEAECTGSGNGDGGCGATLLVEEGDLFVTRSRHRDEVERFTTFKCAACGVLTDLPEGRVPSAVLAKLPWAKK